MFQTVRENIRLSAKPNLIAALPAAWLVTLLCSWTVTVDLSLSAHLTLGLVHFLFAYILLELFWMPLTWFRHRFLRPWSEAALAVALSLVLTTLFCLIFPYDVLRNIFTLLIHIQWRMEAVIFIMHLLCIYAFVKSLRQFRFAVAAPPHKAAGREKPFRPRWFIGAFSFIFGLYFVVLFEWWMVNLNVTALSDPAIRQENMATKIFNLTRPDPANFLHIPKFFQPFQTLLLADTAQTATPAIPPEAIKSEKALAGKLLPGISVTLSGAFLLFFGCIVPLRLMSNVLPSVQHNEAAYLQRLAAAPTYAGQFYRAIIAENPLFSITSLVVLIFLIVTPIIIKLGGKVSILKSMVGPDQILFIFTLLAAWISPIIYAGVHVDRTFGAYFNVKLANLILSVRDHLVVLGFGDLGQRVVNRELKKIAQRHRKASQRRRLLPWAWLRPKHEDDWLEKIITPDLNVEYLCTNLIVVDRNTDNFLFTASNEVLRTFGVVGALENFFSTRTPDYFRQRRRVLVPIVQGDATEPFTLSRVNLERASFLISTVSQDDRIRDIFSRAVEVGLRAIICVSRSNQIVNLTHKAPRRPITLVYPKQNGGATLGQRLIAATYKVQSTLPPEQSAPRIMVVGLNKSNHFMLEMFWYNLSGMDDAQKAAYFYKNLRFVVTGKADIYTEPCDKDERVALGTDTCFTHLWRSTYVTGFRHFQSPRFERSLHFSVPTCLMQTDEAGTLARCYAEFRPDLVVVNDDEVEKSRMLLLWSVNCLERLRYENPNFRLPLLLAGAARGDEVEQRDTGDIFQFYESLMRLYENDRGPGYPRNAYFRREAPRRLIGDNVQDTLADTEEIISGIRDNWEQTAATRVSHRDDVFELDTCIPDTVGSLARLTARLAGLDFSKLTEASGANLFSSADRPAEVLRPSFQYLRHMRLDVEDSAFCLTGFADLQENTLAEIAREPSGNDGAIAMRAYTRDVHDYMNRPPDDPALKNLPTPRLIELTTGATFNALNTQTFVDVMMGKPQNGATNTAGPQSGETFCPGMSSCPIASYQHAIVANNAKEFAAWRTQDKNPLLRAAPSYGCSRLAPHPKKAGRTPHYARIFYCCHAERNYPGLIAVALNLLNFQRVTGVHRRAEHERHLAEDWVANVEYFKDSSCHNRLFALNRLFGARCYTGDILKENNWSMQQYEEHMQNVMPFSLLQIMPVGGLEVARRWFDYARALHHFLNAGLSAAAQFCFQWWDQNENRQEKTALAVAGDEYPIVIQINKQLNPQERAEKKERCEFCGAEDPEMKRSCAQRRPWIEPER